MADPAHRRALSVAARAAGGLDAVVNNASVLGPSPLPRLLDFPIDELQRVYAVNTLAPLEETIKLIAAGNKDDESALRAAAEAQEMLRVVQRGAARSKAIVQAHGGTIAAMPSPLGGLRVEARLPLNPQGAT